MLQDNHGAEAAASQQLADDRVYLCFSVTHWLSSCGEAEAAAACSGAEVAGVGLVVQWRSRGWAGGCGSVAGRCLPSSSRCCPSAACGLLARCCRPVPCGGRGPGSFRRAALGHRCQPCREWPCRSAEAKEPARVRSFSGSGAVGNSGAGWAGGGPLSLGLRGPARPHHAGAYAAAVPLFASGLTAVPDVTGSGARPGKVL